MLDNGWTVIGSWRWALASIVEYVSPVERISIEFVKIVEVVTSVSTSEQVNLILIGISGVHVARTWGLTSKLVVQPFELFKIQYMHIICSKWTLPKPSSDNIQTVSYKRVMIILYTYWLALPCVHFVPMEECHLALLISTNNRSPYQTLAGYNGSSCHHTHRICITYCRKG